MSIELRNGKIVNREVISVRALPANTERNIPDRVAVDYKKGDAEIVECESLPDAQSYAKELKAEIIAKGLFV
jgi:hypothetical protein